MGKKQKNIKLIKRKNQPVRVNEIRTNYTKASSHPTHIYKREGGKYLFVGLTHAPITRGIRNIPLDCNPDPSSNDKTYARPFSQIDKVRNFGPKHEGWKIAPRDKKKLRKIKK